MNSTNRNLIIGVVVLVLVAAGIFLAIRQSKDGVPSSTATTSDTLNFDPNATTSQTIVTPSGTYTITPVGEDASGVVAPDYKAPVAFSAQTDTAVRSAINAQLKETQDVIAGDAYNFEAWVNLGILHKMGGDYQGAATIWRYVARIYPKSTVPLDNLAGLYMDFLKDYARAETNLKASISLDSHDLHAYQMLVDLYTTYGYKTKADAIAIVNQGLAANPNDATLLQLKAELSQ